jgi:hypothetical protein
MFIIITIIINTTGSSFFFSLQSFVLNRNFPQQINERDTITGLHTYTDKKNSNVIKAEMFMFQLHHIE